MHKMQHITEQELDILGYFYEERKGYVRQVKKSVGLSEHTLLKYLSSLEKRKMVRSRKEGNMKMYEVNPKNELVKVFFSYFDVERLEALEYKRRKAVKLFMESVTSMKMPYWAFLFGSTAKGDYTAKSDIDIILIFDSINKHLIKKVEDCKKNILAETGLSIHSILMELAEFLKEKENKKNYALHDALSSGYPIFGNQLYYEVMFQ